MSGMDAGGGDPVEAMIRHQNDGGVFAGFLDQRPQHLIVVLVRHRDTLWYSSKSRSQSRIAAADGTS